MNYYKLKFEREAKANPMEWVIIPCGGVLRLVHIGRKQ